MIDQENVKGAVRTIFEKICGGVIGKCIDVVVDMRSKVDAFEKKHKDDGKHYVDKNFVTAVSAPYDSQAAKRDNFEFSPRESMNIEALINRMLGSGKVYKTLADLGWKASTSDQRETIATSDKQISPDFGHVITVPEFDKNGNSIERRISSEFKTDIKTVGMPPVKMGNGETLFHSKDVVADNENVKHVCREVYSYKTEVNGKQEEIAKVTKDLNLDITTAEEQ